MYEAISNVPGRFLCIGRDRSAGSLRTEAGAGDEARTRDPYLGKVVLFH